MLGYYIAYIVYCHTFTTLWGKKTLMRNLKLNIIMSSSNTKYRRIICLLRLRT